MDEMKLVRQEDRLRVEGTPRSTKLGYHPIRLFAQTCSADGIDQ